MFKLISILSLVLYLNPFSISPVMAQQKAASQTKNVAAADTGGTNGAGNGDDRLEISKPRNPGDVTVPVPGTLGSRGTFVIIGTPGPGQNDHFNVALCKSLDENGMPKKGGCENFNSEYNPIYEGTYAVHYPINKVLSFAPGTYLIRYSNLLRIIQVKKNEQTSIQLQKLNVAYRAGVSFSVFEDFADTREQEHFLQIVFSSKPYVEWGQQISSIPFESPKDFKRVFNFKANGALCTYDFGSMEFDCKDMLVTDPHAGEFVSVFPGTYGIIFKDDSSGEEIRQNGIRVDE